MKTVATLLSCQKQLEGAPTVRSSNLRSIAVVSQMFINSPYALGGLIGPPPSHMQR